MNIAGFRRTASDALRVLLITGLLAACAQPYVRPAGTSDSEPLLLAGMALMDDGFELPYSRWEPATACRATVLALHGLNDYRQAFQSTGDYLAARGVRVLAYDQRGFGETLGFGEWHGSERMVRDLVTMAGLVHTRYPECPLYLLGESMGGAVILAALADLRSTDVEGVILVAPAVWSRDSMPFYQRALLWLAAHSVPARRLTGEGLDLKPSDNTAMLRALGRDPRVIKATRVDVLYGVANLMDRAVDTPVDGLPGQTLFLYGERDEIIPKAPTCRLLRRFPPRQERLAQVALYENGYHMLTRDLQAETVLQDIAAWIQQPTTDLTVTEESISRFCDGIS